MAAAFSEARGSEARDCLIPIHQHPGPNKVTSHSETERGRTRNSGCEWATLFSLTSSLLRRALSLVPLLPCIEKRSAVFLPDLHTLLRPVLLPSLRQPRCSALFVSQETYLQPLIVQGLLVRSMPQSGEALSSRIHAHPGSSAQEWRQIRARCNNNSLQRLVNTTSASFVLEPGSCSSTPILREAKETYLLPTRPCLPALATSQY